VKLVTCYSEYGFDEVGDFKGAGTTYHLNAAFVVGIEEDPYRRFVRVLVAAPGYLASSLYAPYNVELP